MKLKLIHNDGEDLCFVAEDIRYETFYYIGFYRTSMSKDYSVKGKDFIGYCFENYNSTIRFSI